ncbi:MAG: hypothetical protein JNN25_11580 [Candidatus Kapabacteria bacterium]|nr:hypothetical protein [Candidatus Kapabacteria bacterium]
MIPIKTLLLIFLALIFLLVACGGASAQPSPASSFNTIHLSIIPTFGSKNILLTDSSFQAKDSHNVHIDVLKFYVSHIQFLKNGAIVLEEQKSFHLIDAAIKASFDIVIPNKHSVPFDAVRFNLGIDSTTSVSGAMGGDLDPTKGMYWTWQSGYVNFKCEGKSDLCKARNNEFQFHLGGYRQPYYCLQTVTFPVHNLNEIILQFNAETFLNHIDLTTHHHVMSPNAEAVRLSAIVANSFSMVKSNSAK